jgi:ABC-type multidrug transport system ATPase subunit
MIETLHLTKRHRAITAVDDLSLTAPDGQVTGFVGPNGSGKTSTMRMVVGLDRPTSGNARRLRPRRCPGGERVLGYLLQLRADHLGVRVPGGELRRIGRSLYLSEATVKQYVSRLMRRFERENRTQLALMAARWFDES